jgi:hypothetical protein
MVFAQRMSFCEAHGLRYARCNQYYTACLILGPYSAAPFVELVVLLARRTQERDHLFVEWLQTGPCPRQWRGTLLKWTLTLGFTSLQANPSPPTR